MLERFDTALIKIFKRIIEVAAFFGINRCEAMNYWIVISGIVRIVIRQVVRYDHPGEFNILSLVLDAILIMFFLMIANRSYRDDDVLPDDPFIANQSLRLLLFFMCPILDILNFLCYLALGDFKPLTLVPIINPLWFPYFLINQNSGKRATLKSWLKNFIKKLTPASKRALQPVPIPVSNFSGLRQQ